MEGNNLKTKTYRRVDLQSVERFVRNKKYPPAIKDKGDKGIPISDKRQRRQGNTHHR